MWPIFSSLLRMELNPDPDVLPCALQIPANFHMRKTSGLAFTRVRSLLVKLVSCWWNLVAESDAETTQRNEQYFVLIKMAHPTDPRKNSWRYFLVRHICNQPITGSIHLKFEIFYSVNGHPAYIQNNAQFCVSLLPHEKHTPNYHMGLQGQNKMESPILTEVQTLISVGSRLWKA